MNRNDKNKKFTALNINNVFKGKSVDSQNKTNYRIAGMQNIGKVSSMRRVPAPKWTPSIKAETGASENRQIINQTSSGWVNPSTLEGSDPNMIRSQPLLNKDKNQWTSKAASNKPFFLMCQEFPLLHPEVGQDTNIDLNKDSSRLKESESAKNKLEELRNRDNSISVSTLNRIDALSISKSTKGDIAATGWAAEDEEPNFDEKLVFSDDESLNEAQNWHSDADDGATVSTSANPDNSHSRISQHESHQTAQHEQMPPSQQFSLSEAWFEQNQRTTPPQAHYPQFQQFQMQMTMPGGHPFMAPNAGQFSHPGLMARSVGSAVSPATGMAVNPMNDEQAAFLHSVAEQRNARNMEYFVAIERARQKKMGGTGRGYGQFGEDAGHCDQSVIDGRSRQTSMTSDSTADYCTNSSVPMMVEMGPPGGPPMVHGGSMHHSRPHISPMMSSSSASPSTTMIRFGQATPQIQQQQTMAQPQFVMPIQAVSLEHITDPKLMEKWVEFLKQQSAGASSCGSGGGGGDPGYEMPPVAVEQSRQQAQVGRDAGRVMEDSHGSARPGSSRASETRSVPVDECREPERSGGQAEPVVSSSVDKDWDCGTDRKTGQDTVADTGHKDQVHKTKSLYPTDDDNQRTDSSKRYSRGKYSSSKDYRPAKHSNLKSDYSGGVSQEYSDTYRRGDDDLAYEDYHVYKQHYPTERHTRDYNNTHDYRRNVAYQYYEDSYVKDTQDYSYKSNSSKYKSAKSKDYIKPISGQLESSQSERGHSSMTKKSTSDNQEFSHIDRDNFESQERKVSKETRRTPKSDISSYSSKRYDNRPYKDRPTEPARQEFSMGFAVNPKESRRNNYYTSSYNRRYYGTDYQYYDNYHTGNNGANCQSYGNDYIDQYYQSDQYAYLQYEQDLSYPSTSGKTTKRPLKSSTSSTADQWRSTRSDKTKVDQVSSKPNGRPNRIKNDKRQSSMAKESFNDNDQEEWATASEGGSERSNSAPRDGFKSSTNRHQTGTSDQQVDSEDSATRTKNSNENQRTAETRLCGSGNSCHGSWPSYPDEDGSDGASGPTGGSQTTGGTRSNVSQIISTDSTQNRNTDTKPTSNDSSSKDGTNNNNSHKESSKPRSFADFIDTNKSLSIINVDKLPEVTEDEELLYENVEQFQEVLSKATKKNRKLEEQKRLKEELEQKRLEALRLKNKNNSKLIKKPVYRKEQPSQKTESYVSRKMDVKTIPVNREKEQVTNNNGFKKYECNKVSMQIGSWDNSLADDINTERKIPPKPIGTPASTISWNNTVKSVSKSNSTTVTSSTVNRGNAEIVNETIKPQMEVKSTQSTKNMYLASVENSDVNYNSSIAYSYKNPLFDIVSDDKKMNDQLDVKSGEMALPGSITFDYDVKNINCDNKQKRKSLGSERALQKNDQQSLNDKINLVKTIWDNQPASVPSTEAEINRTVTAKVDLDCHATVTTNIQDTVVNGNVTDATPTMSITNVCKVKPQLQQDFNRKDPIEPLLSSAYAIRNSPATFLPQNQGNFIPYPHRIPPEFLQDHIHASDALASLFSSNQPSMHINYNLSNPHLLDSSLLRQNAQDHLLTNKMNFISQQSFYPQAAVTPKLFSSAAGQLPLNMDISSSHGALPLQQLLLTRQNSLTSMMQPNGMSIPFIQSGQQHAQTPLFPATPILGPSSFTNPFSQGHLPAHYSPGNYPSLHQNQQFQQSHQMLLNQQQQQQQQQQQHHHHHHQQQQYQQQQQHHHQQLLQSQISHDRVINSGQSGIFNSIMGSSDISANTGLPDFNGQPKHLNQNNIMHGMNGSAIMLPHNLNILMKPHIFATSSQYNSLQAPIQSNYPSLRNNYENHSNIKLTTELDMYKSSDNNVIDRNTYCIDNYMGLPKQRDEFYIEQNEYDNNCDINTENWTNNIRQSNANNFVQTLDFQSQRSPIQFPVLDPTITYNDSPYRFSLNNVRENYHTLSTNVHSNSNYGSAVPRNKQQFHQDQPCNTAKQQSGRGYETALTFVTTDHSFSNKSDRIDNKKISTQAICDATVTSEPSDNFDKDIGNSEKSFPGKKKNPKQRSSFSDNFEDKTSAWSVVDDDNVDNGKLKSSCNVESSTIDGGSSQSPGKQYTSTAVLSRTNMFDNQCQYGYDETQLSSQTAESLGKYNSNQLKKMIMKLREGPVMTSTEFNNFEVACPGTRKTAVVPRLIVPFQASWNKTLHRSYNSSSNHGSDVHGSEFAGMGFYSQNRALTPPPPSTSSTNSIQLRNYSRTNSRGSTRYSSISNYRKQSYEGTLTAVTTTATITNSSSSNSNSSRTGGTSSSSSSHSSSSTTSIATIVGVATVTETLATNNTSSITDASRNDSDNVSDNDDADSDCHYQHHQHRDQSSTLVQCDNNSLIVDNIIDSPVL